MKNGNKLPAFVHTNACALCCFLADSSQSCIGCSNSNAFVSFFRPEWSLFDRQCVAVQTEYLEALKLAIAQSKRLMNDLCEDIVAASVRSCGQERSQMPSLLYAKEINEWGRMLSAIANNTSHRSGWCLAAPTCTSPPLLALASAKMLRINVVVSLIQYRVRCSETAITMQVSTALPRLHSGALANVSLV